MTAVATPTATLTLPIHHPTSTASGASGATAVLYTLQLVSPMENIEYYVAEEPVLPRPTR